MGGPGDVPVPGDWDGDGDCDPGVLDRLTMTWSAATIEGTALLTDFNYGPLETVPVPGDYDGDGRTDLAVHDRVAGLWWIYSLNDEVLASELAFGGDGSVPVSGRFARGGTRILSTGDEVSIGTDGRYPSIAVDSKDQPHVAIDVYNAPVVVFYDRVDRVWSQTNVDVSAFGSLSGQYYNPHLEIDAFDRAWCSGILCCDDTGLAFLLRTDISSSPSAPGWSSKHINLNSWDTGMMSLDVLGWYAVGSSSDGYWQQFTFDETAPGYSLDGARGQMYVGPGGEKNGFVISRAGQIEHADGTTHQVWHGNTIGCSAPCSIDNYYQNSMRQAQGLSPVAWASTSAMELGDDHNYPGQAADLWEPETAYLYFDIYNAGIGLNIFRDGALVFPPDNLLVIPGAVADMRYGPQGASAANGGLFLTWAVDPPDGDPTLYLTTVAPTGAQGEVLPFGAGWVPAAVTDSEGTLHVVYKGLDGGTKYRRMPTY